MTRDLIGLVGVGRMGGAIAGRLLDRNRRVACHDVDATRLPGLAERGAVTVPTIAALVERCRHVFVIVVDDRQASASVQDLLDARPRPELIVLHSTVSPSTARRLAESAERAGVAFLDAPVSGGIERAAQGTLLAMLGGAAEAIAAARETLEVYCGELLVVGRPGAGQLAKITNNLMSIVNSVVVHEALRLAEAHGLTAADALAVAARGSGASNAVATWSWRSALVDAGPQDHARPMARKDLRLAISLAAAAGIDLPMTTAADRVLEQLDVW